MINNNFNGIYIGTVINNADPKKLGKLKINIPYIYGNINNEDLPWAEPCFPYGSHDKGIFFVPEKGALVSVMFVKGNIYKPIWLGVIFRENNNIVPQEIKEAYPDIRIIKTKTGYIKFNDNEEHIEIKHKNGSNIVFTSDGDIIITAARDIIALSGRNIHLNPTEPTIIPIHDYKSEDEKELMRPEELYNYNQATNDYNTQMNDNCGDQGSDNYIGGKGQECKSLVASPLRQWGVNNRNNSTAIKQKLLNELRPLSRHRKGSKDLRFGNTFATNIENSLDELQTDYPDLYDKFIFTDGFRNGNVGYGASDSMHKYGGAFDFNYSSFECDEREIIYYIFGKHNIACPLAFYNGQDEGMHMEPVNATYIGQIPVLSEEEEV